MEQREANERIVQMPKPIKWVIPDFIRTDHATHLATELAAVLDQLKTYNEAAIYPLISILEPYMETSQELDLRMPPISSRRVIVNVTDKGRAKPDLSIE